MLVIYFHCALAIQLQEIQLCMSTVEWLFQLNKICAKAEKSAENC